MANIASKVPYMVSIGNHEYDHTSDCNNGGLDVSGVGGDGYHPVWGNQGDDSNGECGAPTYYRFNASLGGNSIFWYSFDYNSVHFIMLSSEHNYSANAPGYQWLVSDLETVNRTKTMWDIFKKDMKVSFKDINDVISQIISEVNVILYQRYSAIFSIQCLLHHRWLQGSQMTTSQSFSIQCHSSSQSLQNI